LGPTEPVELAPAMLLPTPPGTPAAVLKLETTTVRGGPEDNLKQGLPELRTHATLEERLLEAAPQRRTVRLQYRDAGSESLVKQTPQPNERSPHVQHALGQLTITLTADGLGRPIGTQHDAEALEGLLGKAPPAQRQPLKGMLESVEMTLK